MAGVNYEVNIQLNAKTLDKQLGDLEKRVNNLKKNLAAPLRNQDRTSQRAAKNAEKAAKLEDRIRATRVITYNLGTRLNKLEEKGVKVNEQRVRLNRAATSTNKKLVEQARTQNKLVREFVVAEERRLKVGVKTGRMQAESTNALFSAKVRRYGLDQQIRRLEEEGLKTDKLRVQLGKITQAQIDRKFATHKQLSAQLALDIRKERDKLGLQKRQTREIERQARIGGPRSPIGGRANISGSPAALASQRQARSQRLQGVALGAGFPLLFGGGPGAILGGAAGGLVGGPAGFAAQIALSAIGQQFDKVAVAAFNTGKALTSTGGTLEFMREKSLFSTEAIEDRAIALEEAGEVEKLAALTASDLAKTIGTDGVKALQDLGKQTNETTKQWNMLTTQLFALISGPLAEFLKIVNSVLGGITTEQKLGALKRNVSPEDLQRIEQIERQVYGVEQAGRTKGRIKAATQEGRLEVLRRATAAGIAMPTISAPVTAEDRRTIKPPKDTEAEKAARKAARELERFIEKRQRFEQNQADLIQNKLEAQFKESQELQNQETLLRAKLAGNEEEVRYAIELGQLQEKYGVDEGRRLADKKAAIRGINEALKEQQFIQATINNLVNTTGQQFAGLFENLINGTNNWNDSLRNVFKTLSSTLFRTGLKMLGGGDERGFFSILSGDFTGKALGGQVSAGTPYMVGERGPEMFVPGANGNIVPNNAIGGVQVGSISITVENTGDQLSPAAQKQIANQVQGIVMSTLVNERRSGGVLG